MIGWVIGFYFFMRYVKITSYFLFSIFLLSLLIDFTENIGRLSGLAAYSPLRALSLSILRSPLIIQQIFPFISLFSAITTLISLNLHLELVIARSIGLSTWQFLFPIFLGAFLFGLIAILIINPLAATGNRTSKEILTKWRHDSKTLPLQNSIIWFTQSTDEYPTIIGGNNKNGQRLTQATFVIFNKNKRIRYWINADTALLKKGYWQLRHGVRYSLGKTPESFDQIWIPTHIKPQFIEQTTSDPLTTPFYAVPLKIKIEKSFGSYSNEFNMYLQSIIAFPAFVLAMTFIAATVSLQFMRGSSPPKIGIIIRIIAGFVLYVVSVIVKTFSNAGYIPAIIAAWFPILIAIVLAISFLIYKENG
ncbi:MAG: lipopolysaccharide export system permease protein [Candidatus Tokpelaia sp. JSC161]|jgi:lipopolysaccharide export system permease protein|nr:MAG: lipopolysaccharide export system permease protein [Candidatus Tokpelaia sp. JSC161]